MKYFPALLPLAALLATSLDVSAAARVSESITNTYPLSATGKVRLANTNGRIEIRAWDGEGVKLEAVKEGRTAEIVAGIQIDVAATPDLITIKTKLPKGKKGWFGGYGEDGNVNYVLQVPPGVQLDEIESVNGQIEVKGVQGKVRLASVNGSIRCEGLAGDAELTTVNGSIVSEHADLAAARQLKAKTVNGSVEIRLPASASAAIEATTVNGSIRSDFTHSKTQKTTKHRLEATIGSGGARLELDTVNGSVRIREARNEHAPVS